MQFWFTIRPAQREREGEREKERSSSSFVPLPNTHPESQGNTVLTAESSHHFSPRIMETEWKQLWYVRHRYFSASPISCSVCLLWFSSSQNNFFPGIFLFFFLFIYLFFPDTLWEITKTYDLPLNCPGRRSCLCGWRILSRWVLH